MNSISHGISGAAIYLLLFSPAILWPTLIGFLLGSLGDTLDWICAKLGWSKRYGPIYFWFHHTWGGALFALFTIAPIPHFLFDKFLHSPVIPVAPHSFMEEIIVQKPIVLSRRWIIWLLGELALGFFNAILILIRIFICL
jgi:hypothetical protein